MKPLRIATVGCGSRSQTYLSLIAELPEQWSIVAGADPIAQRVAKVEEISQNPNFLSFASADELLDQPKLADVLIVATQDNYHFEPTKKALSKGYHVLLEKPACQTLEETLEISRLAAEHQRKVILCFVLRYTPIYQKTKEVVDSGILGDIISVRASEGVGVWHQAHSFVRGHWSRSDASTPMILAKCSHDLDILSWLIGEPCRRVSSFGSTSYFKSSNRTPGSPENCFDCDPNEPLDCPLCSQKYLDEEMRDWLKMIYPKPDEIDNKQEVKAWLRQSPWARNAFACDNDVVDHQVVNMEFANGTTATLTMTAFDMGRTLELYGTKASLRTGDGVRIHYGKDMVIRHHLSGEIEEIAIEKPLSKDYAMHGGGDFGLIQNLHRMITSDSSSGTLEACLESHKIGFAAEASRLANGTPVELTSPEQSLTRVSHPTEKSMAKNPA